MYALDIDKIIVFGYLNIIFIRIVVKNIVLMTSFKTVATNKREAMCLSIHDLMGLNVRAISI